ncbi:MAG TPA: hypothetical protein VGP68_17400 [Gemmataceae bacterium]|nr:hypothetical protein [Gemmataceae bacterium]
MALAHGQLGHQTEAKNWYGRATAWMEKYQPKNVQLQDLSKEAASLLSL